MAIVQLTAKALVTAGRDVSVPFGVELSDGRVLTVERLLRVLPRKRIVGQASIDGQPVLVKLFIAARSEQHWQRELAGIRALIAAGLPTPELLDAMPLPGDGHVLLTQFFPDAESLASAWQDEPLDNLRAQRLLPVMPLLAKMHAAGLTQTDLHLGNFLLAHGQCHVIDGDAVTVAKPSRALAAEECVDNLAIIFAQLPPHWDERLLPFISVYAAEPGAILPDERVLLDKVRRVRERRLKEFLGKLGRDCTQFAVDRDFSRFLVVDRDTRDCLSEFLGNPDRVLGKGHRLKSGATCTVADVFVGERRLVIKRYNLKHWRHALSRLWRPSRAWHAWREGHRLAFYDIATPRPLAMIEERYGPLRRRAFLVTEFCAGKSLLQVLDAQKVPGELLAGAIKGLFNALHRLHITHGDLKASNLLWDDERVFLIDLDATHQHSTERGFMRAWARDRARLLRNWPAESPLVRWLDAQLPTA